MGWSTVARLLNQLAALSPMPDDKALFDDETGLVDRYDAIIEEISQSLTQVTLAPGQEGKLVTLLANSFGLGGGFGVYWGTLHLIEKRPPSIVYPIIQDRAVHGLPGSRYWCCYILGRRRNSDDLPLYITLLRDDIPDVRQQALQAIEMLSQRTSLRHVLSDLQLLLEDSDAEVRKAAQGAIAAISA